MRVSPALPLLLVIALGSCTARQQAGASGPVAPAQATTALHNLQPPIAGRIISGAGPDSPEAFDQIRALGVNTIISVDGGSPDVAAAQARGLRYVHIPVTYSTITDEQRLEIARAVRDLPGPIYIHCHHGKHRGPAAAAAAAVTLGLMSTSEADTFMHKAGTAASYTGLWACVASAAPATAEELDQAAAGFPPVRKPEGLVAAMVEIDFAWGNLGAVRAAGWKVPPNHPDLVPAAEAGRLSDHFRTSAEDARAKERGAEFLNQLMESARAASDLEEGIVASADSQKLESLYQRVEADCAACHAKHRNK